MKINGLNFEKRFFSKLEKPNRSGGSTQGEMKMTLGKIIAVILLASAGAYKAWLDIPPGHSMALSAIYLLAAILYFD